ncbi:MAG: hypothetical protein JNM18_16950 [Planctomycetaceae bacterium]|nr:hypothetical protein [Planctomycetaceae bacterium]
MKKCSYLMLILAGLASTSHGYEPAPCGRIAPAVPVLTYYGSPAVNYTPGHWYGAGPHCGFGGCGREPLVTAKVYYPCQPVRNVLKALAP